MHKPKKLNTEIFGQIDPGKTRKGKTSEGNFIILELREMILYNKMQHH
jgi:hypothetical protein